MRKIEKSQNQKAKTRTGEFWAINDAKTRGHKSLITKPKNKKGEIEHLPVTHSPSTRKMGNIQLQKNPEEGKSEVSYILPIIQSSKEKFLGRKSNKFKIKDPIDKSIVRHIKHKSKNKKR